MRVRISFLAILVAVFVGAFGLSAVPAAEAHGTCYNDALIYTNFGNWSDGYGWCTDSHYYECVTTTLQKKKDGKWGNVRSSDSCGNPNVYWSGLVGREAVFTFTTCGLLRTKTTSQVYNASLVLAHNPAADYSAEKRFC